jgi:deoxyribose-phosphate aldolase
MKNINRYIDHTLLKPEATAEQIEKLCQEAIQYRFFSVCINPGNISIAKKFLGTTDVAICTVIGFPLGANTTETKVFETKNAISLGANEIDMVLNIGAVKSGNWKLVEDDIRAVKNACQEKVLKVIFETCLLTDEEKKMCAQVSERAGADFIKTSTGFSSAGATYDDVSLMRAAVTSKVQVKASGGVRDLSTALKMIELGATRLGTSSGIAIIEGTQSDSKY